MMLPLRDITADSPRICLYLGGVVVFPRTVILTTDYFTLSRRALMLHGFTVGASCHIHACVDHGNDGAHRRCDLVITHDVNIDLQKFELHRFTVVEPHLMFMHACIMAMTVLTDVVTL